MAEIKFTKRAIARIINASLIYQKTENGYYIYSKMDASEKRQMIKLNEGIKLTFKKKKEYYQPEYYH